MIEETILYLVSTGCGDGVLKKYTRELLADVAWEPDVRLGEPLKKVFSRVLCYDFGPPYAQFGVWHTNQAIIDLVRRERPKYVLWTSRMYEILESTFQAIRKEGAFTIGWFFDDACRFDDYSRWWIPYLDYVLQGDQEAARRYQELGAHTVHTLVLSNPEVFKKLEVDKRYDVSHVGAKIADREIWIQGLWTRGIPVEAFGRGWSNGYVSVDKMVDIYNATKINLVFVKSYDVNTRPQMKDKIFDICMSGGFLLCEYIRGIEDLFDIDKEVVCFRDIEEAAVKIRYYLTHEYERQKIAQAGWQRANRDYSQSVQLLKIFDEIEKDTKSKNGCFAGNPGQLQLPHRDRRLPALYHLQWAKVLMKEGYDEYRWQEELDLALFYDPDNIEARWVKQVGRVPESMRPALLCFSPVTGKLDRLFRSRLATVLDSRRIKQFVQNTVKHSGNPRLCEHSLEQVSVSSLVDAINTTRNKALGYVETLRIDGEPYGRYRYGNGGDLPIIYASVFAVLLRHLLGDLNELTPEERDQWVLYIANYQCTDGLFRDSLLSIDNAETEDWWGWRHLTLLALMSLHALGARPRYPLRFIEHLDTPEKVRMWLHKLDWGSRISFTSKAILNYGAAMQYARDFLGQSAFQEAMDELLVGIVQRCNPKTALWDYGTLDSRRPLSLGVQTGHHFWLLYWYEGREIPYVEQAFESLSRLQNKTGGFNLGDIHSSASEDIDAMDPLARIAMRNPHIRNAASPVVWRGLKWVLYNFNLDGGACFKRNRPFRFGHDLMFSKANESSIFATWSRMLALAYGCDLLKIELPELGQPQFNFLDCPGLQHSPSPLAAVA